MNWQCRETPMGQGLALMSGLGLGAVLMYVLDPNMGRRRRVLARDKLVRFWHKTGDAFCAASRDLRNRTIGKAEQLRSGLKKVEIPDQVIEERVRSKMGRVLSHPGAVTVKANQGRVTLSGPILASEVDTLLASVAKVPGVSGVENQLEAHERADDVPALQGGIKRVGERCDVLQRNWSPTTRLLMGATGGALALYSVKRRDPLGATLGTFGAGMLARACVNPLPRREARGH